MAGEIKSVFVDTNVFLRFLLEDVVSQQTIVDKIFEDSASGKIVLNSSIIVFFEKYWVLKKERLLRKLADNGLDPLKIMQILEQKGLLFEAKYYKLEVQKCCLN